MLFGFASNVLLLPCLNSLCTKYLSTRLLWELGNLVGFFITVYLQKPVISIYNSDVLLRKLHKIQIST